MKKQNVTIEVVTKINRSLKEFQKLNANIEKLSKDLNRLSSTMEKMNKISLFNKLLRDSTKYNKSVKNIEDTLSRLQKRELDFINKKEQARTKARLDRMKQIEDLKRINALNAAAARALEAQRRASMRANDPLNREALDLQRYRAETARLNAENNGNRRRTRRFPRNASDIGFSGYGIGYALKSVFKAPADLEYLATQGAIFNQGVQGTDFDKSAKELREIARENAFGGRVNVVQSMQALLQVIKDGVRVKGGEIEVKGFESIAGDDGKLTSLELQAALARNVVDIARVVGPESAQLIGDIIGETVPKIITNDNLNTVLKDVEKFSRDFVFTLSNSRFNEKDISNFLRNSVRFTNILPNIGVSDRLLLATIIDRSNISGRSVGTSLSRFGEELVPKTIKEGKIFKGLGFDVDFFSQAKSGGDLLDRIREFNSRLFSKLAEKDPIFKGKTFEDIVKLSEDDPQNELVLKAITLLNKFGFQIQGSEGFRAYAYLASMKAKEIYDQLEKERNALEGTIEQIRKLETETVYGASQKFVASWVYFTETLLYSSDSMKLLAQYIDTFSNRLYDLAKFFEDNPLIAKLTSIGVVSVLGAAAVGIIVSALTYLFTIIATNPVSLFAAAVFALGMIMYNVTGYIDELVGENTTLGKILKIIVISLSSFVTALAAIKLYSLTIGATMFARSIFALGIVMFGLSLPVSLVIAGVTAIVTAIWYFWDEITAFLSYVKDLGANIFGLKPAETTTGKIIQGAIGLNPIIPMNPTSLTTGLIQTATSDETKASIVQAIEVLTQETVKVREAIAENSIFDTNRKITTNDIFEGVNK